MTKSRVLLTLAFCALLARVAFSQDAVPSEILGRTHMIKVGDTQGTGFGVEYKGKLYFVTARHVVAGLPATGAVLEVMKAGSWKQVHTIKTFFPASPDVDIAVFETDEKIPVPYEILMATGEDGATLGQQVWFLGYPWGLGSHTAKGIEIPFIKRGTMSAIDGSNPQAPVIYIDGFNNPGFSGGPIVYWDFKAHAYRILGVVQGYKEDTAKMMVNGHLADTRLLVNSGILLGYNIKHVIEAIEGK
jgi:S1-C subfamily serine protease